MFVEIFSGWNVTSENICKKAPNFFEFQVGDLNISDILKKSKTFTDS